MGRVSNQTPTAAPPLVHFTHPHELQPLSLYNPQTLCSGCKLQSSGIMYTCRPCNFTLHQSCAKLPQRITHPSHGGCTFTLMATASYSGGVFNCDACNRRGDGWSYHCTLCEFDLHVTCALNPLKIKHQAHISCDLHLTFKNPYVNASGFSCDICRKIGSKQWLYRCSSCEFDVHMDCTTTLAPPPQPMLHHHHSLPSPEAASAHHNQMLMHSASTGGIMNIHGQSSAPPPAAAAQVNATVVGLPQQPPYGVNQFQGQVNTGQIYGSVPGNQQMVMMNSGNMGGLQNNQPPPMGSALGSNLVMAAMQGLVEGAFQGVGQAVVQEVIGGGGGDAGGGGMDGGGGDMSSY